MGTFHPLNLFLFTLSLVAFAANAHNITAILEGFPDYSVYNSFLTQTKLADEINSRQTITCLALNNGAMSALTSKHPLSVVKNILSLHVLLDYYDPQKLHQIPKGTTLTTTLYQTTGNAPGNLGFVNITDLQGGKVGLGSAIPGSKLDSSYTKSVKQIPYNISIIEISAPIIAPGILTAPAPSASGVNITGLLEKAGCKTFASLLISSGVLKTYESALDKGLTVFAPSDEAFKAEGVPDLSKLTNAEQVSLLEYHASPDYKPKGTLKTTKDPVNTLATNGAGKFDLTVTTAGDSVTLHTGVGSSRVAEAVYDSPPFVIFTVDNVLLPSELFGKSPSPAPAPEPVSSPSPTPSVSPSPSPVSEAPSPLAASPPAPPTDTPAGSPADAPAGSSENSTSDNAAGHAEKDVKRKARAKELKTLRRAREKKAKAEAAQSQNTAAVSHNQATVPSVSKGQSQPVSKSRTSKEEELKKAQDVEREKRAAAERRIAEAAAAAGDVQGSSTTVGSTKQSKSGVAGDIRCSCCNTSLDGKVHVYRYNYKYCSTSCMHVHRGILEDG